MVMDDNKLRVLQIPPPIHPDDPDSPLPETILIDSFGYLSDRTNATTARGRRSRTKKKGKRILVTFWPVAPPRVSCFTVHCPDLKPDAFAEIPKISYTEDDLVLLSITICPERLHVYGKNIRYFVYQAGTKKTPPSVKLVHCPPYFRIYDQEVALLHCHHQEMFFIAVLRWASIAQDYTDGHFNLHLYNSKTKAWNIKLMLLDSPKDFEFRSFNKGITIGGELGSVGWVDLRGGIIICDLLLDNQSLRYIPLPSPLSPDPVRGYMLYVRNVTVLQGYIKYFEMHSNVRPGSDTGSSLICEGWMAATKKIKISSIGSTSGSSNWEEDCTIRCSDDVPLDSPVYAQMLPNPQEGDDAKPSLKKIRVGYPALSLHDGDVVYLMHMPDPRGDKACVIALDMRNKAVKGVANFGGSGRPLGHSYTYFPSGISKHLGIFSSTRQISNAAETSRDGK
ncbi:hypothetical protein VPH35_071274 [Triticum aestivum]|uniref:uncharacterized protein n=1 Tax=Triticum aestivum TaxID=4565 RepID=UPI001D00253B|nr:uncharacterized protein LOC123090744 [Triticum aestivum]